MRFNLVTQSSPADLRGRGAIPLSLTLRPSCGAQGEYTYPTDSNAVLRLLEQETDLPPAVVRRFMGDVFARARAILRGVELNDEVLQNIGFFVE